MSPLEIAAAGPTLVMTIARPEARNAIDPEVARAIEEAIDRLEDSADLRVGIITGAPPAFSAGADLKVLAEGRRLDLSTERGGFAGIVKRRRRKPIIAAVDGPALGGGTEIVLACDLVVASEAATFGLPEVKRGVLAAAGGLVRLPRRLPLNIALEWALTGDQVSAERAERFGLVNLLCPAGEALEAALLMAARIAVNAPLSIEASIEVMKAALDRSEEDVWDLSEEAAERLRGSRDTEEGLRAFIERRPPVWRGH